MPLSSVLALTLGAAQHYSTYDSSGMEQHAGIRQHMHAARTHAASTHSRTHATSRQHARCALTQRRECTPHARAQGRMVACMLPARRTHAAAARTHARGGSMARQHTCTRMQQVRRTPHARSGSTHAYSGMHTRMRMLHARMHARTHTARGRSTHTSPPGACPQPGGMEDASRPCLRAQLHALREGEKKKAMVDWGKQTATQSNKKLEDIIPSWALPPPRPPPPSVGGATRAASLD